MIHGVPYLNTGPLAHVRDHSRQAICQFNINENHDTATLETIASTWMHNHNIISVHCYSKTITQLPEINIDDTATPETMASTWMTKFTTSLHFNIEDIATPMRLHVRDD